MKSVDIIKPRVPGWLEVKLQDDEIDHLWSCMKSAGKDTRNRLAGNVSSSLNLTDKDDWFTTRVLIPLCLKYEDVFGSAGMNIPIRKDVWCPYFLESWWVNYQKQTEFNPCHRHTGVYSFVVWMQIPTSYEEQKKLPIANHGGGGECISNFKFVYNNILGDQDGYTYHMDPQLEGTLLFFPSRLVHTVYPFYNCRKDRISIAGNIALDIDNPQPLYRRK